MDKEELIYDGYVKIYDVTKNNNGKIEKFTKVHLRGASAGIVINEEVKFYTLDEIEYLIKERVVTDPKTLISFFLYKDMIK